MTTHPTTRTGFPWKMLRPLVGLPAALLAVGALWWLIHYVAALADARAKVVVGLMQALAWPAVVLLALLVFAGPLGTFLSHIGPRITKLTLFDVGIEVAQLTEFQPAWVTHGMDFRKISPQHIFDSYSQTLFQQLTETAPADFVTVDLGDGKQWLTSRLFLFSIMLQRFRKVRAYVFLGTRGGVEGTYLGAAFSDEVRWTLAQRYPWLEAAFARAYADVVLPPVQRWPDPALRFRENGTMDQHLAQQIAQRFLQLIQDPADPLPAEKAEWVALDPPAVVYEKTRWMDAGLLHGLLQHRLQQGTIPSTDHSPEEQIPHIAERRSRLVAIVGPDGRFQSLVDRAALLEEIALQALSQQRRTTS